MNEATDATPCRSTGQAWQDVAPLLDRWQIALLPQADGTWDVQPGYAHPVSPARGPGQAQHGAGVGPHLGGRTQWWRLAVNVPFAGLPQAIWEVSQRCGAGEGTRRGKAEGGRRKDEG